LRSSRAGRLSPRLSSSRDSGIRGANDLSLSESSQSYPSEDRLELKRARHTYTHNLCLCFRSIDRTLDRFVGRHVSRFNHCASNQGAEADVEDVVLGAACSRRRWWVRTYVQQDTVQPRESNLIKHTSKRPCSRASFLSGQIRSPWPLPLSYRTRLPSASLPLGLFASALVSHDASHASMPSGPPSRAVRSIRFFTPISQYV
jgi:hypothetical protein